MLLPARTIKSLTSANIHYLYVPLKNVLVRVAHTLPAWVTPNRVTVASLIVACPLAWFAQQEFFLCSALCIFIHDILDRLDGAVATSMKDRDLVRNDIIDGAFFDAMVDKVFGFVQLLSLLSAAKERSMGAMCVLMCIKMIVLCALFTIRLVDFFAPKKHSAIQAGGEGKYATAAENAATLCLCIYAAYSNREDVHSLWNWQNGCLEAFFLNGLHFLALFFMSTSAECGVESFLHKWRARYGGDRETDGSAKQR